MFSVISQVSFDFYNKRNPNKNKLILKPVSKDFVFRELSSLNVKKSTGLDEIPPKFIRDGDSVLHL